MTGEIRLAQPTMEILIQNLVRTPFPQRFGDRHTVLSPDQFRINANVSESVGEDGHIKTLVADVRGAPRSLVDGLGGGGVVEVQAGYRDAIGVGSERLAFGTVFLGSLDITYNAGRSGSNVLHIEASMNPTRWRDVYVPFQVAGGTMTYGAIIEGLARASGFTAEVSKVARLGVPGRGGKNAVLHHSDYTPVHPPLTEIEILTRIISDITKRQHVVIISHESGGLVRVVDTVEPAVDVIPIDLADSIVRNGSPMVVKGQTTAERAAQVGEVLEVDVSSLGYTLSTGLHPALACGSVVEVLDHGSLVGQFIPTSVEHSLGAEYETSASGPFWRGKGSGAAA